MDTTSQPLTTVYSCFFPEVQQIVESQEPDYNFLRKNITHKLDTMATPLLDLFEAKMTDDQNIINWPQYRYFTSGSSEALFHLIAKYRHQPLYQLAGEYQGYSAYADSLGVQVHTVEEQQIETLPAGVFFISNPSAIDGNRLDPELLNKIIANHQVVVDLAYLGMTEAVSIDLQHPNIVAVVASLSKPFGLYYFRIGFCWSKTEIPSLYATKWFKNAHSILLGQAVLSQLDFQKMRQRGREVQSKAVKLVNQELGLQLLPSEVYLLAYSKQAFPEYQEYLRGTSLRFCLTPYFYQLISTADQRLFITGEDNA